MTPRKIRIALLATAALTLIALPASAQFGSIFGNQPPPRPPGSVGPGNPRDIEQIPEPDEADIPQNIPPVQPQRLPPRAPAPQQGLPPNAARPPAQQQPATPPGGFQAQPLPPPPGGAAAPETAAVPPAGGPGAAPQVPGRPGAPPAPANTGPQPGDEVVTEMPAQKIPNTKAVFAGLDKITGRIISFDVSLDETVQFGALQVTPKACYTRPPTETPNTDAFAVVDEVTLQGEVRRIFTGWMFASSPGLHGVEHSIYDVWLTDCKEPTPAVAATNPVEPEARPRTQPQRQQQPRASQQQRPPSGQTLPPPGAQPSSNPPPPRRAPLPPPNIN
jgi:hypothetical protein